MRQKSGSLVGNCQLSLCPGNTSPKLLCNSNLRVQFFIGVTNGCWYFGCKAHGRGRGYMKSTSRKLVHSNTEKLFFLSQMPRLTLILRRSRTGTVWFYTSTNNKRAARPKLYTKSLTGDLKRMYSRFILVRISINL